MSHRGIVIRCTNNNVIFNSTGSIIVDEKPKFRKNKLNNNIIHPIFTKFIDFTENDFWINFLGSCAKNKLPKNFTFDNNIIYYQAKVKKVENYFEFPKEPTEETFIEFKKFLKKANILPAEEKHELIIEKNEEKKKIECWKDIGYDKYSYLYEYCENKAKEKNLNNKEKKEFYNLIKLCANSGFIDNCSIIIKDEKITDIKKILWEEGKKFKIDKKTFEMKNYKYVKYEEDGIKNTKTTIDSNLKCNYLKVNIDKEWNNFLKSILEK